MATTSGNDRTQQRGIEQRRGEASGQDVTGRQGQQGQGQQGQQGGLARGGGLSEQRGLAQGGLGRRGLGGYGYGSTSSPFGLMRRLMEDMDRMFAPFGSFAGGGLMRPGLGGGMGLGGIGEGMSLWQPQIDLFEKDGNIVVRADLPGVQKDQVQLRLEDDILYVSGERKDERKEEREGYFHSERSYGSFQRAIQLPTGVDPDQVQASFDNGVLEVKVPMPVQAARGRQIAIGEGKGGAQAKGIGSGEQAGATGDASKRGVS